MKSVALNFMFILFALVFLASPSIAQNNTPLVQFTVDVAIVSFDVSIKDVPAGQPGEVYLDTSNLFKNDESAPLTPLMMNLLRQCPKLKLENRITVTNMPGESDKDATIRTVTTIIRNHLIACYGRGLLPLALSVLL